MLRTRLITVISSILMLCGCAQLDEWTSTSPRVSDPATAGAESTQTSNLYVTSDVPVDVSGFRNIYIAPANLANMQVIQPEGAASDGEWWVTEEENTILQRALAYEFSVALTNQSDFTIVSSREEAQLVINTAVVAVHPNESRASIAKGGRPGGSITASIAVVNAARGTVVVRLVDTRFSDDIWAFNQVTTDDPAINQIFHTWGTDVRRGILQLQGRTDPALQSPLASTAQ